jgi:hypothetical protein
MTRWKYTAILIGTVAACLLPQRPNLCYNATSTVTGEIHDGPAGCLGRLG